MTIRYALTILATAVALTFGATRVDARPLPPSQLGAHAVSSSSIVISWNDSNVDTTGFEVQRSEMPTRHFKPLAMVAPGSHSMQDVGLLSATTYYYRVRVMHDRSKSARIDAVAATTMPQPTAVPTVVPTVAPTTTARPTVTATVTVRATATAQPTTTATRTVVPATATTTPIVTSTPMPTRTVTATVTPIRTATAIVTATVTAMPTAVPTQTGTPVPSPTADAVAPSAPTSVRAVANGCTQVDLSWGAATDSGGSGLKAYNLYRNGAFVKQIAAPATTASDTGLTDGTVYTYTLSAIDNAGNISAASNTANANTQSCNQPPVAIGSDAMVASTAVTFDGSGSYDPDGTIVHCAWNFGDGASASAMHTTHTYSAPGVYTATVTVTDNDGAQASDTVAVNLTNTAGAHVRSQRFGGTLGDAAYAEAVDGNGNVIVTGEFSGSTDFGGGKLTSAGAADIFLAKYSATGAHVWSKRIGGSGNDRGQAVAVDRNGDVLVTGAFESTVDFGIGPVTSSGRDIFVAKYSGANGAHLWSKKLGNTGDDYGYGIAVDTDGSVVVTGSFISTVDFGGGALTSSYASPDMFLVKYAADGTHLWSKGFGNGGNDAGNAVAIGPNGTIAVTGSFMGGVDFGTGMIRSNDGSDDVFVAEFSAAGQTLWARGFGDVFGDFGNGIAVDSAGNVIVTGTFRLSIDFGGGALVSNGSTPADIFLAKLAPNGAHVWSKRFGGSTFDAGKSVAVDAADNIVMTGYFQNSADFGGGVLTSAGGYDIVVAKYSPAGTHVWSKQFGGLDTDYGLAVATDPSGNTVVTGAFSDSVDFGGGLLTSAGDRDVMIVTLAP